MKVLSNNAKITVFAYTKDDIDINDYVKKLIRKLKNKYRINMFGFYQINIYKNSVVGMIADIIKEDDDIDYFNDIIDLKIKVYEDADVYFVFDDYFFNEIMKIKVLDDKYYINIKDLSYREYLTLTDFCNYVYGDELDVIKDKLLMS